ncbi:MAG: glycosyltransferase family 39 protein [bacterium]|nr:glycosyltransferase family 39 protein [bacterium]
MVQRERAPLWAVAILWMAACMGYITAGTSITPFHGDEATQVYMSRDYAYQFIQRDLVRIAYADPPLSAQEQELRLLNGTVNKMLIGLAWHAAGFGVDDLNQQWDWGADWTYNQTTGHSPAESLLQTARVPSAALLAIGAIPMFVIGYAAGGWVGGFAASGLYALHPALLVNGRRAMMEGSLIAFSLLTLAFGIGWIKTRSWGYTLAVGLVSGLALASKHTAIFTAGVVFVVCALDTVMRHPRQAVRDLLRLGIAGILAAVVFLLLNPAWWSDPMRAAGEVLRLRGALLEGQAAAFGGYPDAGAATVGFFRQTFVWQPQYYEISTWVTYIGDQIVRYQASGLAGVLGGMGWIGFPFVLFSGLGFWALRRERHTNHAAALIAAWAGVMLVSALLFTPLEWGRYYLSAVLAAIVLSGAGAAFLLRRLQRNRNAG